MLFFYYDALLPGIHKVHSLGSVSIARELVRNADVEFSDVLVIKNLALSLL